MAALDFPSSPTVGQKYPAAPVAGVPRYTWDGEKWMTAGVYSPVGEAPNDGVAYSRRSLGWVPSFVALTKAEYTALGPPDPNTLYVIIK